jgi:hypothetical protein
LIVTGNANVAKLNANSNVSFTGANVSLGAVGNLHITGGSDGQVLKTDGAGNLSWYTVLAGVANGSSNIAIATAGGNVTTSVAGNANILSVSGTGVDVTGYANISGLLTISNVANITIPGGTNGYALTTDGTGNLSWSALGGSIIANGTSNVRIATSGGNVRFNIAGVDTFDVAGDRLDVKNNATMYFNGGGAILGISAGLNSGDPATLVSSAGNLSLISNAGTGLLTVTGTKGISMNGPISATGADVRHTLTSNSANAATTTYINNGGTIAEIGVYSSTSTVAPNKLIFTGTAAGAILGVQGNLDFYADSGNTISNAIANGTYSMSINYASGGGNVFVKSNLVANSGVYFPNVVEETAGQTPLAMIKTSDSSGNVGFDSTIFYDHDAEELHVGNIVLNDNVTGGTIGINEADGDLQFVVNKGGGGAFEVMRLVGSKAILKLFPSTGTPPAVSLGAFYFNNDGGELSGVGLYFCADGTNWQKVNLT